MKRILKIGAFSALAALGFSVVAFDWPQNAILSDSFYSYFGQLRGGRMSQSLVFSDTENVSIADDGNVVVLFTEHGDSDIFESTLGNAAVIAHDDGMLTVYANLDSVEQIADATEVKAGTSLGVTSNSGWQEGFACLEFQVVDTVNKSFINPRVLMPRTGDEIPLELRNVTAVNKAGISYGLGSVKTLNAGSYLIYNERQDVAIPYKSTIYINGVVVESLQYSVLYEVDGKLCVKGKNLHPLSTVYPSSDRQFLGEISVPRGHNEIQVVISDILGKEYVSTYIVDAR